MQVSGTLSTSFVLVQAHWLVADALKIAQAVTSSHIIVHRIEGNEEYYYLLEREQFLRMLSSQSQNASVKRALDLHESGASPTRDRFDSKAQMTESTVIVEDGTLVGFSQPPRRTRGGTRGGPTRRSQVESVPRKLTADFPEEVNLGSVATLLVELKTFQANGVGLDLDLEVGSDLDVHVQPKQGFEVEGPTDHRFTVSLDDALPIQFRLKATELGRGKIRVLAFVAGQALGAIDLAPMVIPATEQANSVAVERESSIAPITVTPPDLAMVIFESTINGKPTFEARLTDRTGQLNWKKYGPVELKIKPSEYFEDFFKDIENMPLGTAKDMENARNHLAGKGLSLYDEVVPEDLREELWQLRGKVTTVQIQSEEPWIPWELCKLSWTESGTVVEGGHLCEEFAVTRWLMQVPRQPSITLDNMAVVVPNDSRLPFAKNERDFLVGLSEAGRAVNEVEATAGGVRSGLASGHFDAWHFSGHGGFRNPNPNRSAMVLQSGDELTPEDLAGVVTNLGKGKPLVFLNACQIGKSAMGLTGIGGWASKFLQAGAATFIGAYWSVYDEAAFEFAKAFYAGLVGGKTVALATQDARRAVKKNGDPTWLAYTVFSEPSAKLA